MKSIIAAGFLLGCAQGAAAVAGPYANVEANSGWTGNDFEGSDHRDPQRVTKVLLVKKGSWFVQAGPAIVWHLMVARSGSAEFSGKVGASYDVSEDVEVYGEYSFITGDEFGFWHQGWRNLHLLIK